MKRVTSLLFILLVAVMLSVSSCSKKEAESIKPQGTTQTNFELLTNNNWLLTAFFSNGENKFDVIPLCEKDNISKYIIDGDYLYDVGVAKCGNESQIRTIASWRFTDNETKINRSDGFLAPIIKLTTTELVFEENNLNGTKTRYEYKATPTSAAILSAGKWKLTALTDNGNNLYNNLPNCKKDNVVTFKANGEYIVSEGATKCNPNDANILVNATWLLHGFEREIIANKIAYNIEEITETKLELEKRDTIYTYTLE